MGSDTPRARLEDEIDRLLIVVGLIGERRPALAEAIMHAVDRAARIDAAQGWDTLKREHAVMKRVLRQIARGGAAPGGMAVRTIIRATLSDLGIGWEPAPSETEEDPRATRDKSYDAADPKTWLTPAEIERVALIKSGERRTSDYADVNFLLGILDRLVPIAFANLASHPLIPVTPETEARLTKMRERYDPPTTRTENDLVWLLDMVQSLRALQPKVDVRIADHVNKQSVIMACRRVLAPLGQDDARADAEWALRALLQELGWKREDLDLDG